MDAGLDERHHDIQNSDKEGAEYRIGEQTCAAGDSDGYRPEEETDVKRIFERRTKTDDGQRADHAEAENEVGGERHHRKSGDYAAHNQKNVEVRTVACASVKEAVDCGYDSRADEGGQKAEENELR